VLKITPGGGIVPVIDRSGDGEGTELTGGRELAVAADGTIAMTAGFSTIEGPEDANLFRVTFGCSPTPMAGCRQPTVAGKGVLTVKNVGRDERDLVKLKWSRGEATALGDFGDPLMTDDYEICLYDASAAPATVLLELRKLVLRAGDEGKTKITATGRGFELKPMALPLALPVTAQIQAGNGECWEAAFGPAGVVKSDALAFKGVSD